MSNSTTRATPVHLAFERCCITKVYGPALVDVMKAVSPDSMQALADAFNDAHGTGISSATAKAWLQEMGYTIEHRGLSIEPPAEESSNG